MPREVVCSSCKQRLRVPADAAEKWLTCPRCLASVGNPNVLVTAEAPAAPAALPAGPADIFPGPAEQQPASRTCPNCSRLVERDWRFCPYCEEDLQRPRAAGKASSLDRDIKRDTQVGCGMIGVLGAMLGVGIIVFVLSDGPRVLAGRPDALGGFLVWTVIVGLLVVGCVVGAFRTHSKAGSVAFGIFGGLAFMAGLFVMVVTLACMGITIGFTCPGGR
jgi:hypothetical protein